jgi:hypothetical protein
MENGINHQPLDIKVGIVKRLCDIFFFLVFLCDILSVHLLVCEFSA